MSHWRVTVDRNNVTQYQKLVDPFPQSAKATLARETESSYAT